MARPLRIIYNDAWYHILNRGASKADIFHDHNDYHLFLDLLDEVHCRYHFEIHAYCLMTNHYHLLIKTPLANLSRGMRHLDGVYTQRYNRKWGRDGALFRGRYQSILVDTDNYLLQLSRYIHSNPVKAKMVAHPGEYNWSSFRYYMSHSQSLQWLYEDEVLSRFEGTNPRGAYQAFVTNEDDHQLDAFYNQKRLPPILGVTSFCKKISKKYLPSDQDVSEISGTNRLVPHKSLSSIIQVVAEHFNISVKSIHESNYSAGVKPRSLAIYLAVKLSGEPHKKIAEFFKNLSVSAVSQTVRRVKIALENDTELCKTMATLSAKMME